MKPTHISCVVRDLSQVVGMGQERALTHSDFWHIMGASGCLFPYRPNIKQTFLNLLFKEHSPCGITQYLVFHALLCAKCVRDNDLGRSLQDEVEKGYARNQGR
jgi:hypothetical protein